MHELAITESLVNGVADHVGDATVVRVVVHIGRLSGIVPEALGQCFELCALGTQLEGATLEIVDVPGRGVCRHCSALLDTNDPVPLCTCGSIDVDVVQGREMLVKEVEVV